MVHDHPFIFSQPQPTTHLRRFKRIGASECLERERGPGGPPSEMKWSAFALAN